MSKNTFFRKIKKYSRSGINAGFFPKFIKIFPIGNKPLFFPKIYDNITDRE